MAEATLDDVIHRLKLNNRNTNRALRLNNKEQAEAFGSVMGTAVSVLATSFNASISRLISMPALTVDKNVEGFYAPVRDMGNVTEVTNNNNDMFADPAYDVDFTEMETSLSDVSTSMTDMLIETSVLNDSIQDLVEVSQKGFDKLLKSLSGDSLEDLEAKREAARAKDTEGAKSVLKSDDKFGTGDMLFGALAIGLAAAATFLNDSIENIMAKIKESFLDFTAHMTKIAVALNKLVVGPLATAAGAVIKSLKSGALFQAIGSFFGTLAKSFRFTGSLLNKGLLIATGGFSALLPNLKWISGIAKVFSKLFLPLTIFITAWDTVKGAIEGFKEEGIIGGIQGAVTGFFNSLIGAPLDLIKSATGWLLNRMGFENAKETLDKFSFQELFTSLIDGMFDSVKAVGTFVTDIFKGEFSLDKAREALAGLFNLSPIGMITKLVKQFVPDIFERIGELMDAFVDRLKLGSQQALLKITNMIQNVPDQLVKFLSENMRITVPRIAIPTPFGDIVLTEGFEAGVPGREDAQRRIEERNQQLRTQLTKIEGLELKSNNAALEIQSIETSLNTADKLKSQQSLRDLADSQPTIIAPATSVENNSVAIQQAVYQESIPSPHSTAHPLYSNGGGGF